MRTRHQRRHFLGNEIYSVNKERFRDKKRIRRTVDGDAHEVADLLDLATSKADGSQVPENEVVVGSTSLELVPMGNKGVGESPRVSDDLLSVGLP